MPLDLKKLREMPAPFKAAFAVCIFLWVCQAFLLAQQLSEFKIDPGLATLTGAIVGLCVLAWQTREGFKNLIRSQENQAELSREARLHQAELDTDKIKQQEARERSVLVSALWAEIYSLCRQAGDAGVNSRAMQAFAEGMQRDGIANTSKTLGFRSFKAPVFQANIARLDS